MLPGERRNPSRPMFTAEELADSMVRNYGSTDFGKGRGDIPPEWLNRELGMLKLPLEMYAGDKLIRGVGLAGKAGFNLLPASAQGGIKSLGAKAASLNPVAAWRGAPKVKGQENVKEIFVDKPSYHGTSDPMRFELHGGKGNELGIQVPAPRQAPDLIGAGRSPSFSVSTDYNLAKEFADKPMVGKMAPRVIPTVLDKKYVKDILEWRNPSHKKYIVAEYKAAREAIKKDLYRKDGTLRNDRVIAEREAAFDKATLDNIKDLDDWKKTNWDVMETISDRVKDRGWKGYLTVEQGKVNLQVLDGKLIRGVRDTDTGQIMYNTPKPLKKLEEGGPVREGIMALPKPVNLRKKQTTVHKPSKSLVKQGYSPEARLKARYKNVSYIG
jgi:hypothetical protein